MLSEIWWGTEEAAWGPLSDSKAALSAEEMDPGQWWVPEEVGRHM
jgi:hypothetical protein